MTEEVAKSLLTSIPRDMRSLFALDRLDTAHPANHYLNGDALGKLMDLARLYKQVYFHSTRCCGSMTRAWSGAAYSISEHCGRLRTMNIAGAW